MKKVLAISGIFLAFVILTGLVVATGQPKVEVSHFNSTPEKCDELLGNMKLIPKEKANKTYRYKVKIYPLAGFSATQHINKNPQDIAIAFKIGGGEEYAIILTNKKPPFK